MVRRMPNARGQMLAMSSWAQLSAARVAVSGHSRASSLRGRAGVRPPCWTAGSALLCPWAWLPVEGQGLTWP